MTPIDLHSAELLGDSSARLILVEFSDPQCSYAAQHARRTFPHIRDQYVQHGQLRYASLADLVHAFRTGVRRLNGHHERMRFLFAHEAINDAPPSQSLRLAA